MMVNLVDLKIGDSVKLRSGKVLKVFDIVKCKDYTKYYYHLAIGTRCYNYYTKDGYYYLNKETNDNDIIEIIPQSKEESNKLKVDLHNIAEGDVVYCDDGAEHVVDNVTFDQNYAVITFYDFGTFEFNYDGSKFQEDAEVGNIVHVLHGAPEPKEPTKTVEQVDPVNHPSHYTSGSIECIEAIKAAMTSDAYKGYLKGNILKYIWRFESKGKPAEDLKKARTYLEWLIKEVTDAEE